MYLRKEVSFLFLVFPCIPPPPQSETFIVAQEMLKIFIYCISGVLVCIGLLFLIVYIVITTLRDERKHLNHVF